MNPVFKPSVCHIVLRSEHHNTASLTRNCACDTNQARIEELVAEEEGHAAFRIQCAWFERQTRVNNTACQRETAATTIQARHRGDATRAQRREQHTAATRLQAAQRGRAGRAEVGTRRADRALQEAEAEARALEEELTLDAVTFIQAHARGMRGRRDADSLMEEQLEAMEREIARDVEVHEARREVAATTIQVRGVQFS